MSPASGKISPGRMDPTRTTGLRRAWMAELRRRFAGVRQRLKRLVAEEDAFGLEPGITHNASCFRHDTETGIPSVAVNQRFRFLSTPEQLKAFRDWLARQVRQEVLGRTEDELWRRFVEQGFKAGQKRVWTDFKKRADPEYLGKSEDFYAGTREEFLRSSFVQPVAVEKVKLLASRVFTELKGVTDAMATTMSRVLVEGLVRGERPVDVAGDLAEQVGVSLGRAERIARTECLPANTLVDGAVVRAVFRRWYEGPMAEIVTRSGRKFSTTQNHPMLTSRGWIGAGDLQEGDHLVSRCREQNPGPSGNGYVDYPPTTLGEIFRTAQVVGVAERVACSDHDFHGDGRDGEVDVLRPDRQLMIGRFAAIHEHLAQKLLTPAAFAASAFCPFCRRLLPVNGRVCLCLGSQLDAALQQSLDYTAPVEARHLPESRNAQPGQITAGKLGQVHVGAELVGGATVLPRGFLGRAAGPGFCSEPSYNLENPLGIVTGSTGNLLRGNPGEIELDQVALVRIRQFRGHVFNLETDCGYFTIDSLYTGNTIRAHAEGQLQALEDLGVTEVGVMVEWTATDDSVTCPQCRDMEGIVMSVEDAAGLIPLHPNCRCAWLPAGEALTGNRRRRAAWNQGDAWRGGSRATAADLVGMLSPKDRALRQLLLNCRKRRS